MNSVMEHLVLLVVKFLGHEVIYRSPGQLAELILYLVLIVGAISVVLFIRYRLRLVLAKKTAVTPPPDKKKPKFLVD
jgi:hypothetical protein